MICACGCVWHGVHVESVFSSHLYYMWALNQNFVDLCGKHLYLLGHLTAWKHVLSYKFPKEQGSSI